MYSLRWYGPGVSMPLPSMWTMVVPSLGMYLYWQAFYIVKTEVFDRKTLQKDAKIMTSLRWMSQVSS
jgi:hypothetical protein